VYVCVCVVYVCGVCVCVYVCMCVCVCVCVCGVCVWELTYKISIIGALDGSADLDSIM